MTIKKFKNLKSKTEYTNPKKKKKKSSTTKITNSKTKKKKSQLLSSSRVKGWNHYTQSTIKQPPLTQNSGSVLALSAHTKACSKVSIIYKHDTLEYRKENN